MSGGNQLPTEGKNISNGEGPLILVGGKVKGTCVNHKF